MSWFRPLITLLSVWGAIIINAVSNQYPPNGESVADLSNNFFAPVLIIPKSYAFAIWGLIYIGLIALSFYQLPAAKHRDPKLNPTTYFLVLASLAQCLWVYLFLTRQFGLSVLAMGEILVFLMGFYLRLRTPKATQRVTASERWYLYRPISLYMGWISVATIVNVASMLHAWGWDGGIFSAPVWTAIMMSVAAFLALRLLVRFGDVAFLGVIVWALVAIALKHLTIPIIAITGFTLSGLLLLLGLLQMRQHRLPQRSQG